MIRIAYTPSFIKQTKILEAGVFEKVVWKIKLFKNPKNHKMLKVHKLHGRLKDFHAFSVNHHLRIIFEYVGKSEVLLHDIGGHEIY
ncbi:MAG: hypothetical protein HYT68_00695 [Candidatus Zambryskibacteria bacterium]|nr:hypothetical protein [Candidatus Zambryskibacteria bacterium]